MHTDEKISDRKVTMTSVEFRPVGSFTSPLLSTRSTRASKDGTVSASCILFLSELSSLFVCLTDGKIIVWEVDEKCEKTNKDSYKTLTDHKGDIRTMIFVASISEGVMLSGAADRCIKMWDVSNPRQGIHCVHSLHCHGGTILALESGPDVLLSTSTDGFLCIWRDQTPAKLLRYPAFSVCQKLTPDKSQLLTGVRSAKETWFLSLFVRKGEMLTICAGDSDGYVHILKSDMQGETFVVVWKEKIHDRGISRLIGVPMEAILFTLSYDQRFKRVDNGHVTFEESNRCGAVFTDISWDPMFQDVIVADDHGHVGIYNFYQESCVVWKDLVKETILMMHFESSLRRLLALSPHAVRVLELTRVKFQEITVHTNPVVSIVAVGPLLYTAAMDNTIRLWDADTLECVKVLREKRPEITAMVFLPCSNVVITGHENSDLKMWSLESSQDAALRTVSGASVHGNTISALTFISASELGSPRAREDLPATACEVVVAGSYDRQLSFWKVTKMSDGISMAKFERVFLAHEDEDEILAVIHSPAAKSIFSGGNAGIIRKWDQWGHAKLDSKLEGHEDAITCFAVGGTFLYSGSADRTVRIWDTSTGDALKTLTFHKVALQALLFLPDSGFVASCAFDGRVVLWDPQQERASSELQTEQREEFRCLAYIDLTRSILVGCESGKIVAFPLPI